MVILAVLKLELPLTLNRSVEVLIDIQVLVQDAHHVDKEMTSACAEKVG